MKFNPSPLSGFRDFGQREQGQRQWLIRTALQTYARYGYLPIETPALERNEVLQGQYGEEGDHLRYSFEDHGKRQVGLRYDLTVPFARFVARFLPSQEIRLPFRRAQVAPVWRSEKAQAGRYREFYQCDIDIAGSSDPLADAEVVTVAADLLKNLGIDYTLRISHRGVINAFLRSIAVPETAVIPVLIALDKLDKIGQDNVSKLLAEAGLDEKQINAIAAILAKPSSIDGYELDEAGQAALADLNRIVGLAKAAVGDKLKIDFSIVRGLAYYTGMVLETTVKGAESFGSILSGGRYDNIIGSFLNRPVPAVGISLGVDRCLAALESLGLLPEDQGVVTLAVLPFPECKDYAFKLANRLRADGIDVVLYPDKGSAGQMLGYASTLAEYALLIGEEEAKNGSFPLKDLRSREQETYASYEKLLAALRK